MKVAGTSAAEEMVQTLAEEHRSLEARLRRLTRRGYLTPEEQREAGEIKRRKLATKDRLHALRRAGP